MHWLKICPTDGTTCIYCKFVHKLQIWPPDGASRKFGHQVALVGLYRDKKGSFGAPGTYLIFARSTYDQEKKGKAGSSSLVLLVTIESDLVFWLAYLVFWLVYLVFWLVYLVFWLAYFSYWNGVNGVLVCIFF